MTYDAHPVDRAAAPPGVVWRILHRPLAASCFIYLTLIVLIAVFSPILLSGIVHQGFGNINAVRQGPNWHHLLGTDTLGRDILDRLLVGTTPTMLGVAEVLVTALAIGLTMGLAAGFFGGWADGVVGWLADLGLAFPGLIIVIVVASLGNMVAAMATLGVVLAPGVARVSRAAALPLRNELYIVAARVSGISRLEILRREVLPRIAGVAIVQASSVASAALVAQAGLAFLGLLPIPPTASWGGMVAEGAAALYQQPWLIWPPGIVLALTVIVFWLFGDAMRDIVTEDWAPRRRAKLRRYKRNGNSNFLRPRLDVRNGDVSIPKAAESNNPHSLLRVERLTVGLSPLGAKLIEDVTFDIHRGETVGLMGESGSGKTITALSILGLLPSAVAVTAGRVLFAEHDVLQLSERQLRKIRGKQIGFISQDPMIGLTPVLRIGWQLDEIVRCHEGLSRSAAHDRSIELLRRVHLPDPETLLRRYPHELSGGMAQRVTIAAALAGRPRLLIADEPTTALDVTVQAEILDLLRELNKEEGIAVLLITHDGGIVADLCERVIVMYAGQIVERADTVSFFDQPLHPYTKALLASNPHHFRGSMRLQTIPGSVPAVGTWPTGCHFESRCGYATAACRVGQIPLETIGNRETRCINYESLLETNIRQ